MPVSVESERGLAPARTAASSSRSLAAGVVFLGAFLLFQIQPTIAKVILPWFGGTAAVWATCVLFFQGVLLFGYVYAHWLAGREGNWPKWVHIALVATSVAALPVIPSEHWKPQGSEEPVTRILVLLAVTVGLPYFVLASTSPLVQAWMARSGAAALPYRFYALSNLASLVALLAYPVVVEPLVATRSQARWWSAAYGVYAIVMAVLAWRQAPASPRATDDTIDGQQPSAGIQLLWVVLAALASAMSLALTNHLCQNVAPIPFLWVLPLGIYLLSLILTFDGDGWYRRLIFLPLQGLAIGGTAWLLINQTPETPVRLVVPAMAVALFIACMYLHGELAQRKPSPRFLTRFYLMMSLGGMVGGVAVSLGAPYLLKGNYEFPIALAICAIATLMLEYRKHWLGDLVLAAVAVGATATAGAMILSARQARITARNFYGGLRIVDSDGEGSPRRTMVHGAISHGFQFLDPKRRLEPTSYYAVGSGVGAVIDAFRRPGLRAGVVGLGAGALAIYGRAGETYRYFEINPQVRDLARSEFTFLDESAASVDVLIGDGRLCLEREPERSFDLIVIDAFSGDSIPVHLLTREAVQLYMSRLRADGALAIHISNTALRLAPVVAAIAADLQIPALLLPAEQDRAVGRYRSEWMLLTASESLDRRPELRKRGLEVRERGFPIWTDDYSNLFNILK